MFPLYDLIRVYMVWTRNVYCIHLIIHAMLFGYLFGMKSVHEAIDFGVTSIRAGGFALGKADTWTLAIEDLQT
jgi:hypothetical protein